MPQPPATLPADFFEQQQAKPPATLPADFQFSDDAQPAAKPDAAARPGLWDKAKKFGGDLLESAQQPMTQTLHNALGDGVKPGDPGTSVRDSAAGIGEGVRRIADKIAESSRAGHTAIDFAKQFSFPLEVADKGLQAAGGLVDFLTTPVGAASLALPGAPATVRAGAEAAFGTQMAHGAGQSIKKAYQDPTSENQADALVNTGMALLPAIHGAKRIMDLKGAPVAPGSAERLPSPEQAEQATTAAADAAVAHLAPEPQPSSSEVAPTPQDLPVLDDPQQPEARTKTSPTSAPLADPPSLPKTPPKTLPADFFGIEEENEAAPALPAGESKESPQSVSLSEEPPATLPAGFDFSETEPAADEQRGDHSPEPEPEQSMKIDSPESSKTTDSPEPPEAEAVPNGKRVSLGGYETVKTPNGTKARVQHAIVEADDAVTSHDFNGDVNPAYDGALQLRDRSRAASGDQLRRTAAKMDPREVGSAYLSSTGAPILRGDLHTISGNNRTNGLKMMYDQHPEVATRYRAEKGEDLASLGLPEGTLDGYKKPLHVRILRDENVDPVSFAEESNAPTVAKLSASEQASTDSPKLTGDLLQQFRPSEDGSLTAASNRDFVRQFIEKVVPENDRGGMMAADGTLSQDGVTRIRNAVFHSAYGDPGTLEKLAESTDSNIKNVTSGMLEAAPAFAKLNNAIDAGEAHPVDFRPDLAQAVNKLSDLKDSGGSVKDYLDQGHMFGSDITPEARSVLEFIDAQKRSKANIGRLMSNMAKAVEALGDPRQEGIFGSGEIPSKSEVLHAALNETQAQIDAIERVKFAKRNAQGSLLATPGGAALETDAGKPRQGASAPEAPTGTHQGNLTENEPLHSRRGRASDRVDQPLQQQQQGGEETGPHGPVYREFKGKPKEALAAIRDRKAGVAAGAIQHVDPKIGSIGLPWGIPGTPEKGYHDGIGVSHLDNLRKGWLDKNIERIGQMPVTEWLNNKDGSPNAAVLHDGTNRVIISRNWGGKATEPWLLTGYEQPAPGTNFSVPEAPAGAGPTPPATGAQSSAGNTMDAPSAPVTERQSTPSGDDSSIPPASIPDKPKLQPYRNGDFLEFRGEDARVVAREIGVTLMRDRKTGEAIAGLPLHSLDRYTPVLSEKGYGLAEPQAIVGKIDDSAARKPKFGDPDYKKSERGSVTVDVGAIRDAIHETFGAEGPQVNYSGLGAQKDRFVRNLSQLEMASPAAHAKAVEAASAKGQVKVLMRSAIPQIERELGDLPWPTFRKALVESRLQGIRDRWSGWAKQVESKNPDQVGRALKNGLMDVLRNVEGKRGIPADVESTVIGLLGEAQRGAIEPRVLSEFLANTFEVAAKSVASVMTPDEFETTLHHPNFQKGRAVYQDLLERPIAESHMQNEGVFSTALGPADSYYPLVPMGEEPAPVLSRSPQFQKPKNIANDMATGLAKEYDTSSAALENRLTRAFKANSKAGLIQSVIDHGLLLPLIPGEVAGDTINIGGTDYAAKTIELNEPYQRFKPNGRAENIEAKLGVVPKWLADELEPILKRPDIRISSGRKLLGVINKVALAGPTDAVFHATNLLGTMVANTPFLGESIAAKTIGNTPFTKVFTAIIKTVTTDPESAESVRDLAEMSKLGLIPDKFGSVTYSKRFADSYGAEVERHSLGPALYGPRGLDVRARLVMWRVAKHMEPNGSMADRAQFVNQLGNYVQGLQGGIERSLKQSVAPFYTAGSTMYRNGVNAVTGRGPLNRGSHRVAQQLSGGLIGLAAAQVLAHRALNGNMPWEDKRSKLGKIPLPDALRHSELGNMLFGKGNDTGYISLGFFNPIAMRGARALGLPGAYDEGQLGGSGSQRIEAALKDMGNTVVSPVTTGPLVKAAAILAAGSEPYATSINPPKLMPATDGKRHGMGMLADRAKAAALAQNPFAGNLADASGFGSRPEPKGEQGNRWLKMASAIAFPRLFAQANIARQSASVRQARAKQAGEAQRRTNK